jgi:hypothetical protein
MCLGNIIFASNLKNMSTSEKNLGKYWLYFIIANILCVLFLIFLPEWFWVMLPFQCTYFVQAMDWM